MKINPQHVCIMREAIAPLAPKIEAHFAAVVSEGKSKNPAMRVRWDAARAAGLIPFLCNTLYTYANDEHIDTALRAIMRDIFPPAST